MKKQISRIFLAAGILTIFFSSCKKDNNMLPEGSSAGTEIKGDVDSKLAGTWLWTEASDGSHWDSNGTYQGSAYGLARQFTIKSDGTGSCFDHLYSSLYGNNGIEINISSKGFFVSDTEGHLGYFPQSGTYDSTGGDHHQLSGSELYDTKTKAGNVVLMQKLTFTKVGNKDAFAVTSSDGITDTYVKQ